MYNNHFSVSFDGHVKRTEYTSYLINNAEKNGAKGITRSFTADYSPVLKALCIYFGEFNTNLTGVFRLHNMQFLVSRVSQ